MDKDIQKIQYDRQKKQQWSKSLSTHFAKYLAINNPNSPMKKSYDNSYHCASVKHYDGEKMTSTYCKNRWCYTCNRIRTAININNYAPEINKMGHPFFVTLTKPTVLINDLPGQIEDMEKSWRALYKLSKDKRKEPFKCGIYLKGVRSMECTIRPNGHYHYHFHIIVDGWANAEYIRSEWLKRNESSKESAQDVRPADKGALMEVFKYAIKTSVNLQKDTDYKRLDEVFQVLKGKRTVSTFGGLKTAKNENEDFDIESQVVSEMMQLKLGNFESVWKWEQLLFDWVNIETGELLINEPLPDKIKKIVTTIPTSETS